MELHKWMEFIPPKTRFRVVSGEGQGKGMPFGGSVKVHVIDVTHIDFLS